MKLVSFLKEVSERYIENKKEDIRDAVFRVFQRKPLYEMTMLDVIIEAGLSHGGIYKYYDNVDQVIVATVNQITAQNKLIENIDQILEKAKNSKEAIKEMLLFLGRYIQEHLATIGKIQFDLTVMIANHPEKSASIVENLTEQEAGQYGKLLAMGASNQTVALYMGLAYIPVNIIGGGLD